MADEDLFKLKELREKSLKELYDIATIQFLQGQHHQSLSLGIQRADMPVSDCGYIKLTSQNEPDENTYDAGLLMAAFFNKVGEFLTTPQTNYSIEEWLSKLEKLYDSARRCEENVEVLNIQRRRAISSHLNNSFFPNIFIETSVFSAGIKGCQAVFRGYAESKGELFSDNNLKRIYELISERHNPEQLEKALDRFGRDIGMLIKKDENESELWRINIIDHMLFSHLNRMINSWSYDQRKIDAESENCYRISANQEKIDSYRRICDHYIKSKYGIFERDGKYCPREIEEIGDKKIDELFGSEFNEDDEKELEELLMEYCHHYPGGVHRYLYRLGIKPGEHYVD